jgi:hypothetical protein
MGVIFDLYFLACELDSFAIAWVCMVDASK